MELLEAIKTRRSIRDFTGEKIPDEDIEKILDSARYAPSPENLQMHRYVVIRDDQAIKNLVADLSLEMARQVFGSEPYELTQGRLWYIPEKERPSAYEAMREGSIFAYPKFCDTLVIGCASESFNDAHQIYPNYLFGSVVVGMGILQMWLTTCSMGYGASYLALPIKDPRHREILCERLGIPRTWEPIGILCIGVPRWKRMLGPSRFPLEGIAYSERWGNPYRRLAFKKRK